MLGFSNISPAHVYLCAGARLFDVPGILGFSVLHRASLSVSLLCRDGFFSVVFLIVARCSSMAGAQCGLQAAGSVTSIQELSAHYKIGCERCLMADWRSESTEHHSHAQRVGHPTYNAHTEL
jgi:hypothetical protein